MKNVAVAIGLLLALTAAGQTSLKNKVTPADSKGAVSVWDLTADTVLGKAYTIESTTGLSVKLKPCPADMQGKSLVVSMQQDEQQTAANAYLVFVNGSVHFKDKDSCNAIPVYKLVDDTVLTKAVKAAPATASTWRFFVEKKWVKNYDNGKKEAGRDLIIVDFTKTLNLAQASKYIKELRRNTMYFDGAKQSYFTYESKITACLLDKGPNSRLLLNGEASYGDVSFNNNTELIVIE